MELRMKAAVCAVLSVALHSSSSGLSFSTPRSPVFSWVARDVTFDVSPNLSNVVLKTVTWTLNNTNNVVNWLGSTVGYGQGYAGRAHLNTTTGSLTLFRLTLRDSGQYSVSIITTEGVTASGSFTLQVFDFSITQSPIFGQCSGNVTFDVSIKPSNLVLQTVTWTLNNTNMVVSSEGSTVAFGQDYIERAHLNTMTGSLSLFRLTLRDSGQYSVSITTTGGASMSESVTLNVLDYSITPSHIFGQGSGNVTFDVSIKPSNMVLQMVTWTVNTTGMVVSLAGSTVAYGQGYEGRAHLNTMTGSLSLFRLTLRDSGQYCVNFATAEGAAMSGSVTLNVLDPVSVPKIYFNDTVTLTCMASGSDVSYQWFNGSSEVLDTERILLSVDRKTLMISDVVRSEDGPFYCYVYNNVSNSTSKPFSLDMQCPFPRTDYSWTTEQLAAAIIGSFLGGICISVITTLFVKFIRRSAICGEFPESKPDKNENTSVNYENVHNTKKLDKDISVTSPNTDHLYMGLKVEEQSTYSTIQK